MTLVLFLLRHTNAHEQRMSLQEAPKELCVDALRVMSKQHCTGAMHAALNMLLERFADDPSLICSLAHLLLSSADKVGILYYEYTMHQ